MVDWVGEGIDVFFQTNEHPIDTYHRNGSLSRRQYLRLNGPGQELNIEQPFSVNIQYRGDRGPIPPPKSRPFTPAAMSSSSSTQDLLSVSPWFAIYRKRTGYQGYQDTKDTKDTKDTYPPSDDVILERN